MKKKLNTLLLFALFLGSSFTALADGGDIFWTGDGDGWRWEDPDNWDTDEVPNGDNTVIIAGDVHVEVTMADAACMSVFLDDDATLLILGEADLTVAYSYEEGIFMDDNSSLVIWGALDIHDTGQGDYTGNGIEMTDNARVLNRGELSIANTDMEGDGIDMEDNTLLVNRGSISISYTDEEGIEMDDDAIFRNQGSLEIMYVSSDAIDQDDSDSEFLNSGTIDIAYVNNEGIEVDDGNFISTETGEINISFVSEDMVYVQSGGNFENYGLLNLLPIPFNAFPEPSPEAEETPDAGETPPATGLEEVIFGAVYVDGSGNFTNHNIVDIYFSFGFEAPGEDAPAAPYYNVYGSLKTNPGGTIQNKDCATIFIDGPFPIYNEGVIYNEGTIELSLDQIPTAPPEEGPMFGEHVNLGYFFNDGDILSDYPFSIGPNPIDELWDKSSLGENGEGDEFVLGCDIVISTSSRQDYIATSDDMAFLNQTLCGNSMITARLDGVSNGYAGLMIREGQGISLGNPPQVPFSGGSKLFAIAGNKTNRILHGTRYNEGDPLHFTPYFTPHDTWLRLERIGNYIRAYHSNNGESWFLFHQVYIDMDECAEVGLFTTSRNGNPAVGTFSNVEVSGSEIQPLSTPNVPTPEVSAVKQGTKVWPTPVQSQFTLEFEQATTAAGTAVLRNELGQAIGQRKLEPETWQLEWDANTLPTGLYLLEVQTEDGYREVLKVLKQ